MKGAGGGMLGKDGKGLVLCGLVGFWVVLGGFGWFWGPCWPMLGEVGSLFARWVMFHVWFTGHIPQE